MTLNANADPGTRITIEGTGMPIRGDDIDTDRIIPARYLKLVTFDDLGSYAFYDARFDEKGAEKAHPFNDKRYGDAAVLVVNKNFGCGSSREHAPQSLMRSGTRVIIGESFAEIFAGNCAALGIPTVTAPYEVIEKLHEAIESDPGLRIRVDLKQKRVDAGDRSFALEIPATFRSSLLSGTWDTTSALLERIDAIRAVHDRLPYIGGY